MTKANQHPCQTKICGDDKVTQHPCQTKDCSYEKGDDKTYQHPCQTDCGYEKGGDPVQVCDSKDSKSCPTPGQGPGQEPPTPRTCSYDYNTHSFNNCNNDLIISNEMFCGSVDFQPDYCYFEAPLPPMEGLEIVVDVVEQYSDSACTLNNSFGAGTAYGTGYVWVKNGCEADFVYYVFDPKTSIFY